MKKIEEMISRLCPEGVKYEKLILCADILYGYPFDAKLFTEDESFIPLIRIRDVVPGFSSTFYKGEYEEKYIILKGDMLVGMDGNFNLGKWKGSNGILCQRTLKITSNDEKKCLNNYLFHLLGPLFKHIEEQTPGGSVKHLSAKVINEIEIPLPHPDIQKEIVRILDNFTSLQENLEEELKLRQKQYEYYCDQFFGGDIEGMKALDKQNGTKVIPISELGEITRGKRFVRDDVRENGQPCIHYGDMYTFYGVKASQTKTFLDRDFPKKMRYAKKGDVIIVGAGENDLDIGVGLVWFGEEPAAVHDACYILEHNINPMYISYYLRSSVYHLQLRQYVSEGKICSFSGKDLGRVLIPVPILDKQQEIVNTLDKFEAMIANVKEEIELRKKQYEYYREKLLTF